MSNSKQVKRTKDQHFVPRLHLQYFTGDAPKNMVWTYSKRRDKPRPSRVQETGFQKNYYSVRSGDGVYHDDIEDLLAEIESKAAAPYRALLAGDIPSGQARADFAVFVATCFSRSPAQIRSWADAAARSAQIQLRMSAETRGRFDRIADAMERDTGKAIPDRDSAFAFINDPSRYTLGISEKRGLQAIGAADAITPLLYERSWVIAEALEGRFVTSDNPVCRWVPAETISPIYGDGGFANPRAQISFPLSSTKLLIIAGVPQVETVLPIDGAEVLNFNRIRAAYAEDLVFADRNDAAISAMVEEFRGERPRMLVGHPYVGEVEVQVTR